MKIANVYEFCKSLPKAYITDDGINSAENNDQLLVPFWKPTNHDFGWSNRTWYWKWKFVQVALKTCIMNTNFLPFQKKQTYSDAKVE
jgi:hypothetical protein